MLTLTLFMLFGLACLVLLFQRRKLGLTLLAAGTVLFGWAGNGGLAGLLLNPLQRPYQRLQAPAWGARTAVVVLGNGAVPGLGGDAQRPFLLAYSRILEGVRIYRTGRSEGKSCSLLFSGGDPFRVGAPESRIYGNEALGLGVAEPDLILESRSLNTFKNAEYTSALIRAGGFDQVILVTSSLHMRRSLLYFSHFGLRCVPAPADLALPIHSWIPLAYNLAMADAAVHEYLGILRYKTYNLMGWNPPAIAVSNFETVGPGRPTDIAA